MVNQIQEILDKYYYAHDSIIDENGLVNGSDISLKNEGNLVSKLHIRFGKVVNFDCSYHLLSTLDGAPSDVEKDFTCRNNRLKSLIGGPRTVGLEYFAQQNPLTSLEGIPDSIGVAFRITYNESLPLLRCVTLNCPLIAIYRSSGSKKFNTTLITKYHEDNDLTAKAKIWKCQQDLIANGFEGNAAW
jgi:hypothetical protein